MSPGTDEPSQRLLGVVALKFGDESRAQPRVSLACMSTTALDRVRSGQDGRGKLAGLDR